jgi:hypothetical protein
MGGVGGGGVKKDGGLKNFGIYIVRTMISLYFTYFQNNRTFPAFFLNQRCRKKQEPCFISAMSSAFLPLLKYCFFDQTSQFVAPLYCLKLNNKFHSWSEMCTISKTFQQTCIYFREYRYSPVTMSWQSSSSIETY